MWDQFLQSLGDHRRIRVINNFKRRSETSGRTVKQTFSFTDMSLLVAERSTVIKIRAKAKVHFKIFTEESSKEFTRNKFLNEQKHKIMYFSDTLFFFPWYLPSMVYILQYMKVCYISIHRPSYVYDVLC